MNCKVCGKAINDHSNENIEECLYEGFSKRIHEAAMLIASKNLIAQADQDIVNRNVTLTLSDGEKIVAPNLAYGYAKVALTMVYDGPHVAIPLTKVMKVKKGKAVKIETPLVEESEPLFEDEDEDEGDEDEPF